MSVKKAILTIAVVVFAWASASAVLIALSAIVNGYVLMTMWEWFIVATFSLPDLTFGQAMGMALIVSLLTYHYRPVPKKGSGEGESDDNKEIIAMLSYLFVRPLVTLGLGWIYLQFV